MQLPSQILPKHQPLAPRPQPGSTGRHPRAGQAQPKFGSLNLPPNATSQFLRDILGVWVPKMPLTRSKSQFFEDAFLENVENIAFYFAIPIAAPVFAKGLTKLYGAKDVTVERIGSSWKELAKELGHDALKKGGPLVGAKIGTLVAVITFAAGWEYMVQHVKNVITAKQFNTKNFAAVAGLESAKTVAQAGEMDPVEKTKRRAWQVGSLMAGGFTLAALLPKLVANHQFVENAAPKVLTYFHFGSNEKKGVIFDLTKPMLATLAGIGACSYIDAARDWLERKETALRLCLVIPYMLVGKELAGNALAKIVDHTSIDVEKDGKIKPQKVKAVLKQYYEGTGLHPSLLKGGSLWEQFKNPDTLLDLNKVKDSLAEEFEKVAQKGVKGKIPTAIQEALITKLNLVGIGSYLLSAVVCGLGINWLAYRQTKHRYELQQQQLKSRPQPSQPGSPFWLNSAFSGHARPQSPFARLPYQPQYPTSRAPVAPQSAVFGVRQPVSSSWPHYAWPAEPLR
jgi:hypothetical protein